MAQAWMVRSDGEETPVRVHIYGNEEAFRKGYSVTYEDLQETVDAAIWLYKNTQYPETRKECIHFLAEWLDLATMTENSRIVDMYAMLDDGSLYKGNTDWSFIEGHESEINQYPIGDGSQAESLAKSVCILLDNEFLRVRKGGLYNSDGNSTMYFRVSSVGFNWFDIIFTMVYNHKPKYVTVCRDYESTGAEGVYRVSGEVLDEIPYDDFINLKGRPVIKGRSFQKMNRERRIALYEALNNRESKHLEKSFIYMSVLNTRNRINKR